MRKVFMGYTSYQKVVYDVAKFSIERHSPDVEVRPIIQSALRDLGIYTRPKDENGSTEFSITRFLTPWLAGYKGWVLFCDNDMLCQSDINELFDMADDSKAVMVVKHRYTVKEGMKLDGQVQFAYPRKNWSSVILFNAGHPSNKVLTPELINSVAPLYLHRFQWLHNEEIGEIPHSWNWLVGVYKDKAAAKMIHFTDGGCYFKNYQDVPFADKWKDEFYKMSNTKWTKEMIVDL
jgi:lipopolysaccharide biosynthesis glycosyltransferase